VLVVHQLAGVVLDAGLAIERRAGFDARPERWW
jgi:hypothetical protein